MGLLLVGVMSHNSHKNSYLVISEASNVDIIVWIVSNCHLFYFLIKFPYNAHSYWLKQRALSENRPLIDDIKMAFNVLPRNFDKFGASKQ